MARPRNPVPTYRKHPDCDQARCWVGTRWVYLGAYGSPESMEAHRRVCAEVAATSAAAVAARAPAVQGPTVNELLLAFLDHAEAYYVRPDGTQTNEVSEYRQALRVVRRLYGSTPAREFGPVALKAVQTEMASPALGWCRTRVNKQVGRVRRCWAWGVGAELVPETVARALGYVTGLRRKRSIAREAPPVKPAPEADYEATLPQLVPTVRTMVQLQRVAGLRPGEVRLLVPADLDTSGDLWLYAPEEHKMAHLGRDKAVPLPPSARALIEPRLAGLGPRDYLFTPRQALAERHAAMRAARKSKVPPSQLDRSKPAAAKRRQAGNRFTVSGYVQAVARACAKAGVPAWTPGQLRHSFGTEVRERFGLEVAQILLGHKKADVTQLYAEIALAKGLAAAKELG